ncbi:MAG: hypothetical protein K2H53_05675 [Clostridia bacterium]|nr:hypothetical protein [Clostridia bacterium]
MKESLSFDLQEFENAVIEVFKEVVEEEIQRTESFKGQYVRRPTGSEAGKIEEDVFHSNLNVAGVSVHLIMYLSSEDSSNYQLKSLQIECIEAGIKEWIDIKKLKDFKISYPSESGMSEYIVRV